MKHLLVASASMLASFSSVASPSHGHGYGFGASAQASQATRTVEVKLKDIAFEPGSLKVKAGETVRFVLVNEGNLPHEFNLGSKAMHVEHQKEMIAMQGKLFTGGGHEHHADNTVLLQPGQRGELTWTFSESAPIEFACNVPGHYQAGMVGPLTIE
jgi:uncharacterized cupredoxin-like copper-binding protein